MKAGESRVLVLRGEAGVGKTALLDYVVERAAGCRVARAAGVESEVEFAFAGLQRLCAPLLDGLEGLPAPQRDALATAFGLENGSAPDRFLVGLAVQRLLSDVAKKQPLVCVVDDLQWLDRVSARTLAFVARRLSVGSVGLILALGATDEEPDLTGLAELEVHGLTDRDARALLESVVAGPLDERVRDRIVAETRGNPLALLELSRGVRPAELAGGFGLPDAPVLSARIEESLRGHLAPLPPATRRLLLLTAADPLGDPVLMWRAAAEVGIDVEAAAPAAAGLVDFGASVRFSHPRLRSAVYRTATPEERRRVHRALAGATDAGSDPDRRAWHRAHATAGLDEDVAAELERSADHARARGGLAAAAAFLERAVALTPAPGRRARRALAAARSKHLAGAPDAALRLLAMAEAGPLDALEGARAELLRARITLAVTCGREGQPLLLEAARRLELLDPTLAREAYLDAFSAALSAGRPAHVREIAAAVLAADWKDSSAPLQRPCDLLLEGLAVLTTEGYAAGAPVLKRAVAAFRHEVMPEEDALRWHWLVCHVARALGDDEAWDELAGRFVQLARGAGALSLLPIALNERSRVELFAGNLVAARALAAEADATIEATGSHLTPNEAHTPAAWHCDHAEAPAPIDGATRAELLNGLGRWEEALAAAESVAEQPDELGSSTWVSLELVEAAVRSGSAERAARPLARLAELAAASGSDWALGIEACSRALLREGETAERLYREAIERLGRTRIRMTLARAHLLYGEWLRREKRRLDAREQLRVAHELFGLMGAFAFTERARRELLATGETARKRIDETRDELTAQEAEIARLAAEGRTNPEIGAQLFLSPRTVEWHLRKVYPKLGINSRRELRRALPVAGWQAAVA